LHLLHLLSPFQGLSDTRAASDSCHRVNNLLRSEVNFCRILGGWAVFVKSRMWAGNRRPGRLA
jgi:hypothetical protein